MLKRTVGLYLKYLATRWKYRGKVKFNGFTVIYAFPDSEITFSGGAFLWIVILSATCLSCSNVQS